MRVGGRPGRSRAVLNQPTSEARSVDTLRSVHDAIEAERAALARKLHDHPLQELAGVGFQLERITMALERGATDDAVVMTQEAGNHLRSQIDALRDLMSELHPPQLDRVDLAGALLALTSRLRGRRDGVALDVEFASVTVDELTAVGIYRIVQTMLSALIERSAPVGSLALTLTSDDAAVVVTLTTDAPVEPASLDTSANDAAMSIDERVHMLGGVITISGGTESTGPGATVRIAVPLGDRSSAGQGATGVSR